MTALSAKSSYQSRPTIDNLIQNGQPTFGVFAQVKALY